MNVDLNQLIKEKNAIGALLLRRDGYPIKVNLPPHLHTETVAIMMATVYGAAYTSTTHIKNELPKNIVIESDSLRIEITPLENSRILAVIIEK